MQRYLAPLLAVAILLQGALADFEPMVESQDFDAGRNGKYPTQTFRSSSIEGPLLNIIAKAPECDDKLYTLLSPRGSSVHTPAVAILDPDNHLVWSSTWQDRQLYNLMVQDYKGEKYLTFWAGDVDGGHGSGDYIMLDKNYNLFKQIKGGHDLETDLHEFRITQAGTAVITLYEAVYHDLAPFDKGKRKVWDGIVQEIDIETGEVIFQWRALDHYNLADTARLGSGSRPNYKEKWDWFHLNSVDKDRHGNYLISARWLGITYVNGITGEIIWALGGKRNMFEDLSSGRATSMYGQHDVRWNGDDEITMLDNGIDEKHTNRAETRGLRIKIDQKDMTAEVIAEYRTNNHIQSISQGSLQVLPSGNILLGYGNSAAWSEHRHDGSLLCQINLGPSSQFGKSYIETYRVQKFTWQGYPLTSPDVALVDVITDGQHEEDGNQGNITSLYVSWNGATEVVEWALQGSQDSGGTWVEVVRVLKTGFETSIELRNGYPTELRAVGLGRDGNVLGTSRSVSMKEVQVVHEGQRNHSGSYILIALVVAAGLSFSIYKQGWHRIKRWRGDSGRGSYELVRTSHQ
ncbi:ASST-domain-containing protein [Xylariales sp. PMI_506]|nr:ASST-domain-containing protein [Xylariales sp. PMI_506]